MAKMYSEFTEFKKDMTDFKDDMIGFKDDMTGFKDDMIEFKDDMTGTMNSINKTVIRIENEHGEKLSALFEGWKQNTDKLDRIEKEISRQDGVILRKIK
ncbi:MAG: hypothetical protein ACM3KR_11320 [Deltaproteobacteria bacterium]